LRREIGVRRGGAILILSLLVAAGHANRWRNPARIKVRSADGSNESSGVLQAIGAAQGLNVTVSPQPQFLHQFSELDTLGIDRPECTCKAY
jgi:hypothetical protein